MRCLDRRLRRLEERSELRTTAGPMIVEYDVMAGPPEPLVDAAIVVLLPTNGRDARHGKKQGTSAPSRASLSGAGAATR
jgi:hypothetical protein